MIDSLFNNFSKPAIAKSSRGFCAFNHQPKEKNMNNNNKTKVTARFAPETRFTLPTATNAPFRTNLETEFERLKNRLLAETLDDAEQPELNAPLRRAANDAAALAWVTFYPLLVFPALFEEKSAAAVHQVARQARIYANSREIIAA